jgi:hypothetical protein
MKQPGLVDKNKASSIITFAEDNFGILKCTTCYLTDCYSHGSSGSCAEILITTIGIGGKPSVTKVGTGYRETI